MGKTRDFRAETIENIKENLIDNENAGDLWDSVGDFFRDVFSFNSSLDSDLGNFDAYMNQICEVNDITGVKLEKIIHDVYGMENIYSSQLETDAMNLGQIVKMLNLLETEIGKGDFDQNFNRAALNTALQSCKFTSVPLDFTALSPEAASKAIGKLPAGDVPAALALFGVDGLCGLNPDYFDSQLKLLYYDEVASRLVVAGPSSAEAAKLAQAFYNADYARYLSANPGEKDTVMEVVAHELVMPENDLKKVNNFLSPLDVQDQVQIKFLAYRAKEPYKSLFVRYLDRFRIASTNVKGVFKPSKNTLDFDVVEDRVNPRGHYYIFFHEVGHAIDNYYGKDNGRWGYYTTSYKDEYGLTLVDYNKKDFEDNISQKIDDLFVNDSQFSQWGAQDKQRAKSAVLANLMNYNLDMGSLTSDEIKLQYSVRDSYTNALIGPEAECASDIYGGVTNNAIHGRYHHSPDSNGDSYWLNKDNTVRRKTSMEAFAAYYGWNMVADPVGAQGLASINTYLPDSQKIMDAIIQEMGK